MEINAVHLGTEMNNRVSNIPIQKNNDYKELLNKLTGVDLANEIQQKYNITLEVGSISNCQQLFETYDIRCMNYVNISPETLLKMEKNPALKHKILNCIEEFCSPQEQAKVKALQPPVKSSGMILYPDGSALYWLESYPNDLGKEHNKKMIVTESTIQNVLITYDETGYSTTVKT